MQLGDIHGDDCKIDLEPKKGSFKCNGQDIKFNTTYPNEEIFSVAQEFVRPADEPFAAEKVFEVDSSYHEGSPKCRIRSCKRRR